MHVPILGSLLVATAVSAANIAVQVGPTLTFNPTNVKAAVGDVVIFTFEAKNHTVTQSSFTQPCVKAANALDSGFKPVTSNSALPTFQFTVNSTDPLWFYCAQTGHCKAGMVFAVNPTADKTFAQFQNNAESGGSSGSSSSGSSATTSSGSGSSPSGTPSGTPSSGGSSSGSSSSGSGATGSSTGSASTASSTGNAAVMISSNFGGLLTVVGLIAGLSL